MCGATRDTSRLHSLGHGPYDSGRLAGRRPRGGTTIWAFDTLDRKISETYQDGSSREFVYDLASDVVTYTDENGSVFSNTWDPMSRKINTTIAPALGVGGTTAQSFQYNGLSQTTFARDTANGSNADSFNRLLQYQRGILSGTGGYQLAGGGSVTTAITLPNTDQSRNYTLDGLGNWRATGFMPVGGSQTIDQRNHNYVNEITQQTVTGSSPVVFQYDGTNGSSNGNLTNDGTLIYSYDALNRPIQINRVSDGLIIATYLYDAMNRRMRKTILNGGLTGSVPNSTTDYIWSGSQVVEERNAGNTPIRQYVWGTYIDELIQLTTLVPLGPQNLSPGTYYLLQDLLYRAEALTDSGGNIVEAYDCDAYGNTLIFTASYEGLWWNYATIQSDYGANEVIYCGYRYDPEAELYYVRNRSYRPALGRWLQRDPIGYAGGINLYEYVGGRAVVASDPEGLMCDADQVLYWTAAAGAAAAAVTAGLTCLAAVAPEAEPEAGFACLAALLTATAAIGTQIGALEALIGCEKNAKCPNRGQIARQERELRKLQQERRQFQQELNQSERVIKPPRHFRL